jgi:hypothetical protein
MARPPAFIRRHRAGAAVALAVLLCCAVAGVALGVRAAAQPATPLQTLFNDYQDYLLSRPGVVSVGIGERDGVSFIQVYVRRLTPQVAAAIPRRFGGWPVSVKPVKVRTPRPRSPRPTPVATPSRTSQLVVGARGTVAAVVMLAHPTSRQALGSLLIDRPGGAQPLSATVTRKTGFFQARGATLVPLPPTTFGRALRGHVVKVGLADVDRGTGLTRATALTVVLDD